MSCRVKLAGALVAALALPAEPPPEPPPASRLDLPNAQFGLFGTLGLAATGTDKVQFRRDATQMGGAIDHPTPSVDSRLGLQFSSRFAENWLATVQAVSRQRYDGSWRPDLQWASATWTPGRQWEFKLGRLGLERTPNGDFTNVGYTMLWVRPPVEMFGSQNFSYIDGLSVNRGFSLGDATLTAQLAGGFLDEKSSAPKGGNYPLDLTDSEFWTAILKFRRGPWRGRASYSQLRVSKNIKSTGVNLDEALATLHNAGINAAVDRFHLRGHQFQNIQVGAAYERGPVQAQAAIQRILSDVGSIPSQWSGFLSFGYRVGALVPYGIYSRAVSRRFDNPDVSFLNFLPGGAVVGQFITAAAHAQEVDQWTLAAGLRWDLAETACLKVQVDRVRDHNASAPWLSNAAGPGIAPGWDGKATVLSVTLDFVFGGVR